jgi:hypothetical protein
LLNDRANCLSSEIGAVECDQQDRMGHRQINLLLAPPCQATRMTDTGSRHPRLRRFMPRSALAARSAALSIRNLMKEQGHLRTIFSGRPVDPEGSPTPWFTYGAIAYLAQFDLADRDVFEFGSGNSTLFWQSRARSVVSVEDDPVWYREIQAQIDHTRVDHRLITSPHDYVTSVSTRTFDIIVIDGSHREQCVAPAIAALRSGGMIILDNADWFPDQAQRLREEDLIEVDFTGFGPINRYTSTTSLFLRRDVQLRPIGVQPRVGRGGLPQNVRTSRGTSDPVRGQLATEASAQPTN